MQSTQNQKPPEVNAVPAEWGAYVDDDGDLLLLALDGRECEGGHCGCADVLAEVAA